MYYCIIEFLFGVSFVDGFYEEGDNRGRDGWIFICIGEVVKEFEGLNIYRD